MQRKLSHSPLESLLHEGRVFLDKIIHDQGNSLLYVNYFLVCFDKLIFAHE